MANDVNQYSVDLSRLTQRVNELRANETKLKAQQDALNKAFKEGKITEDNFKKATEQLTKQVQQNKVELQKMGTTVANLKKETEQSAQGIEKAFGAIWGAIQGGLAQIMNAFETFRNNQAAARAELRKNHEEVLRLREEYEKLKITLKDDAFKQELSDAREKKDVVKEEVLLIEQLTKATDKYDKITKQLAADEKEIVNVRKEFKENFRSSAPGQRLAVLEKQIAQAYIDQANAKKAQADAERELNTFYNNQQKKADEDALKQIEERKKKEKELADQKKKAAEERAKADQDILKQLEDLQIKCIDDETERQKAQIELNKKRTIQALNEISKKASATGKKNIEEVKKLLEQINVNEIMQIDSKIMLNKFKSIGTNITEIMRSVMLENETLFITQPTAYVKTITDAGHKVAQIYSTAFGEGMEEAEEDFDWIDRQVNNGNLTTEQAEIMEKAGQSCGERFTNGYLNVLSMSEDEIQRKFKEMNVESFKNYENYEKYIDNLFSSISEFASVFPQLDYALETNAMLAKKEITQLGKVYQDEQLEYATIANEKRDIENEQIKRYKEQQKQVKALAVAEVDRLNTVFKDLDEQAAKIDEEFKQGLISEQQMFDLLAELESTDRYKDYARSIQEVQKQLNDSLAELEFAHQQSMINAEQNYENRKTLIAQEASERRRQIMAEEFDRTSRFYSSMGDIISSFADIQAANANDESKSNKEREKARRKQLNLQIASVYLGMASSLAEGISTATSSSSNWIEMLIAIASSVAAIVSQFAQIKSLMSQKNSGGYATGGLIGGKTKSNSKADDITANVSAGEYVINSNATRDALPFLDTLNYGGASELAKQMAFAVAAQPAPVVAVETIENVQSFKKQISCYSHL